PRSFVDLLQGLVRLFNPVGRELDVRTPFVTAGTEGTEFFVSYDSQNQDTVAGVIEGQVRISRNGDQVSLGAGEAVRAPRMGRRPSIAPNPCIREWGLRRYCVRPLLPRRARLRRFRAAGRWGRVGR